MKTKNGMFRIEKLLGFWMVFLTKHPLPIFRGRTLDEAVAWCNQH